MLIDTADGAHRSLDSSTNIALGEVVKGQTERDKRRRNYAEIAGYYMR